MKKVHTEIMAYADGMSDNDVIARVQVGQVEFFDCVIVRYEQRIFRYIMRFVNNPDEARDLTQIVFIKVLNHIATFDVDKKFSSWIYRIAHNETVNWLGRNHIKTLSIEDMGVGAMHDIADGTHQAVEVWFQTELRDALRDALAQMPPQYADVLRMRYFEDRSYKEISEIVGKPINSVGTLVRRAKKRLLAIVIQSQKF